MNRRVLVKTMPVAAAGVLAGCAGNEAVRDWTGLGQRPGEDFRMRILRYAVLAPNSHNAQPWLVDLSRPMEIALYVDKGRLLPRTDPRARQIHISQGTFLETLDIAARQAGYLPEIEYFPEGEYGSEEVAGKPVARVSLATSNFVSQDPLFSSILARHTNKLLFDRRRPVPDAHWPMLESTVVSPAVAWRRVTAAEGRRALTAILKDAMAVEVSNPERNRETAEWFRFSDAEMAATHDGFGIAQNGASGLRKWVAERFLLDRKRAADPGGLFARSAVSQTGEQAGSAQAFAALVTAANTRLDQLMVGRAYARIHLTATRLGLRMQPFSQALEEYPEMMDLQRRLKTILAVDPAHTIQMLFRLGYAASAVHPLRRDPASLVFRSQGRS